MFVTILLIALFILLVCAAYQNDRLNKIEEVQKNTAGQLPYIKSVADLNLSYMQMVRDQVREIHEKMFKPRPKKEAGYIAELPDPTDYYAGISPKDLVERAGAGLIPYIPYPHNPFDIKVSFGPNMVEVGEIKVKYKMSSQEFFDEVNRLISEGKLKIRNCKIYRNPSFKGTSKFYFSDSDGKKADGRGKGPRDAHGRFTTCKEKKSKSVFNEA